jgi:hypothetical protein
VTLPVGVGPALLTLALKVTLCPAKLGLAEDVARDSGSRLVHGHCDARGGIGSIICIPRVLGDSYARQRARQQQQGRRKKQTARNTSPFPANRCLGMVLRSLGRLDELYRRSSPFGVLGASPPDYAGFPE